MAHDDGGLQRRVDQTSKGRDVQQPARRPHPPRIGSIFPTVDEMIGYGLVTMERRGVRVC